MILSLKHEIEFRNELSSLDCIKGMKHDLKLKNKLIIKSECLESIIIWYLKVEHGSGATEDGGSKVHPKEERDRGAQKAAQEEELTALGEDCSQREACKCCTSPHECSHKNTASIKSGALER